MPNMQTGGALFEYGRKGEEFSLGNAKIFVEDIEDLGPSVEVEFENLQDIGKLVTTLAVEIFDKSVPELVLEARAHSMRSAYSTR